MKLNGIKCTNYTAGELFSAVLYETDAEVIKNINPERLIVQADDGSAIEALTVGSFLLSTISWMKPLWWNSQRLLQQKKG